MLPNILEIPGWLIDKLSPAAVSAIVAFAILHVGRRRELRKLSLEMYKEFYSPEFSERRYEAEKFFAENSQVDWRFADPYARPDLNGTRKGYASVTRFYTRLSILYQEKELDRRFTEKLLSQISGYWWGFVYEHMSQRKEMYTREAIIYIFKSFGNGSRSGDFQKGYQDGVKRRASSTA